MNGNARILRLRTDEAAAAITSANHATFRETIYLPDAYDIVGNLDLFMGRLPQLIGFVQRSVHRALPHLHYDDRGRDPSEALADASDALLGLLGAIEGAHVHSRHAHSALGHLGLITPED